MARNVSDKSDTKHRIVAATISALQRSGLPPLSYDMVADEAGMTRQAVRYHFPDAEALMLAVCDCLADAYRTALINNAARLEGPQRVDMFLDFYFNLLDGTRKPKDDSAYDAMMSLATGSAAIRDNLRGQYKIVGEVMSYEFRVSYPQLSPQAAEELSYLFVCLMYGHWKMVATLGVSVEHNRLTRAAVTRLIRSYCETGGSEDVVTQIWASDG
ncbi:DNA-binding transcriptional regulator, AcrR family [Salinihabitans flavidus]|uniref:DNA-binding transcriptional regulator, AcrR family n=2 Tax=Salinihabitans flavidus TaxID=569882 RepID=A0A1H8W3H4_9RHOB|nr:DNA-binding transcriptional regulator, AcrR family [Salinihabitans flavidus]